MAKKWICQTYPNDEAHQFDECSEDGFCTECPKLQPPEIGILIGNGPNLLIAITDPVPNQKFVAGNNVQIQVALQSGNRADVKKIACFINKKHIGDATQLPATFRFNTTEKGHYQIIAKAFGRNEEIYSSEPVPIVINGGEPQTAIGLCVILMDASDSMGEPAFKNSLVTRRRLIANTAASGIFDLERLQNNQSAYVALVKFDDRVQLMFIDTIANILEKFDNDLQKFSNYIHDELLNFSQGTDINKALQFAHKLINGFTGHTLSEFPLKSYSVMKQRILTNDNQSVLIPNTRVLIYTDGRQYDTHGNKILMPNPFKQHPIQDVNHDIVIGAFFGQQHDEGCNELRSLLSHCPIHDEEQFFLFNDPAKIGNLRSLFRMASGASGFCPKCLEKQLNR